MNWIILIIIVTIAVASAIAQMIKSQQEQQDPAAARKRPTRNTNSEGIRAGNSDMDRFLQEIEKLRKRSADGEEKKKPTAKPVRTAVPTVAPVVKKAKRIETVPTVAPKQRVDRLPPAKVLTDAPPALAMPKPMSEMAQAPLAPASPIMSQRGVTQKQSSPFADKLTELLKDKNNIAMVVTLNEIFGPPKSKR